jgi:hypothetical protein
MIVFRYMYFREPTVNCSCGAAARRKADASDRHAARRGCLNEKIFAVDFLARLLDRGPSESEIDIVHPDFMTPSPSIF